MISGGRRISLRHDSFPHKEENCFSPPPVRTGSQGKTRSKVTLNEIKDLQVTKNAGDFPGRPDDHGQPGVRNSDQAVRRPWHPGLSPAIQMPAHGPTQGPRKTRGFSRHCRMPTSWACAVKFASLYPVVKKDREVRAQLKGTGLCQVEPGHRWHGQIGNHQVKGLRLRLKLFPAAMALVKALTRYPRS